VVDCVCLHVHVYVCACACACACECESCFVCLGGRRDAVLSELYFVCIIANCVCVRACMCVCVCVCVRVGVMFCLSRWAERCCSPGVWAWGLVCVLCPIIVESFAV